MMVISEFAMFRSEAGKLGACVVLAAVLGWMLRKVIRKVSIGSLVARLKRWEFWPPVVFYVPVAAKYLALAIKYRSFSLPTLANPGMYMGGVIGESKFETLADLSHAHPEAVAKTHLVRFDSVEQQTCQILRLRNENDLQYPLVLKPDVGQRGYGFKVIHSDEDIQSYVACFTRDVLVQKYVPGPLEAGNILFCLSTEPRGVILFV